MKPTRLFAALLLGACISSVSAAERDAPFEFDFDVLSKLTLAGDAAPHQSLDSYPTPPPPPPPDPGTGGGGGGPPSWWGSCDETTHICHEN